MIELKKLIVLARQDLVETENKRIDAEKRIKDVKEKNASLMHDKKFYLQKIVDQREELKQAKVIQAKQEDRIRELEEQLEKNQKDNRAR